MRGERVGGGVGEDLVGGRFSPSLSLQDAFSLILSQSLAFLFIFLQLEDADHTWGVILTTAIRGRAVAESKQEYPRSSQRSPPSHCHQSHSLRLCV